MGNLPLQLTFLLFADRAAPTLWPALRAFPLCRVMAAPRSSGRRRRALHVREWDWGLACARVQQGRAWCQGAAAAAVGGSEEGTTCSRKMY